MKIWLVLGLILGVTVAQAGGKPEAPEIGWATIKNNRPEEKNLDACDVSVGDGCHLFGLYDGNRSFGSSDILRTELLADIKYWMSRTTNSTEAIVAAFNNLDGTCNASSPENGSSAIVGVYSPNEGLTLAYAGLCRAFTIQRQNNEYRILSLNEGHTLESNLEQIRIHNILKGWKPERLGELIDFYPDEGSRQKAANKKYPYDGMQRERFKKQLDEISVNTLEDLSRSNSKVITADYVMGFLKGAKAIKDSRFTRSIGDGIFKDQHALSEIITYVPHVIEPYLNENSLLVLISSGLYAAVESSLVGSDKSSDAVFKYLRNEIRDAIRVVTDELRSNQSQELTDVAARVLADLQALHSAKRRYYGDMTLMLVALPKVQKGQQDQVQPIQSGSEPATASTADDDDGVRPY